MDGHHLRELHGPKVLSPPATRCARITGAETDQPHGLLHRRHADGDDPGLAGGEGRHALRSATFMVSLQDFSEVGDTAVFLGEPHIDFVEQDMLQRGYLDSRQMSTMFNLLRSNDLIWSTW